MKFIENILKSEKSHSVILEVLFVIYILFDIQTPKPFADFVDTSSGKLLVVLVALSMFVAAGPIAGILALLAGYTLIKRSSKNSFKYTDGAEEIKMQKLKSYNDNPNTTTLEEEVVADMAPIVRAPCTGRATYKPVLDKLNDAAPIHYQGVV